MKRKLIAAILIITLLFTGCTKSTFTVIGTKTIIKKHFILGSIEYVEKINNIAKKSGNQSAFTEIMSDVDENGKELDDNEPNNIIRFHKLISSILFKIGTVDMKTHYFRNKLNRVPKNLKELINTNKKLPEGKRWSLVNVKNSGYHIQGRNGEYNLKFLSYDGYCEAVYDEKGILLDENNDPINMGTYNYSAGIPNNSSAHGTFDVSPYIIWGNCPNSPEKGKEDINKGVDLAMANYKNNTSEVYAYREHLFGMQQGRVSKLNGSKE